MSALLQFFSYAHLKDPELQACSKEFAMMAQELVKRLPDNPERAACIRKLLEAKDCAVRSLLWKDPPDVG